MGPNQTLKKIFLRNNHSNSHCILGAHLIPRDCTLQTLCKDVHFLNHARLFVTSWVHLWSPFMECKTPLIEFSR